MPSAKKCTECGEILGTNAECDTCYSQYEDENDKECLGAIYSRLDPFNAYTPDGERAGRLCKCEDYPCCGH